MGLILAIHCSTFFQSIQVSTVAIGLLTFSTFPIFVTFLEPYFFKERLKLWDIVIAIVTFLGIILIIPKFQLGSNLTQGVLCGILSGFTYAILSMLNRQYVKDYPIITITFYEQFIATILEPLYGIILAAILLREIPSFREILGGIIILGTVFYSTLKSK